MDMEYELPSEMVDKVLSGGDCRTAVAYCAASKTACDARRWQALLLAWYGAVATDGNAKRAFVSRCENDSFVPQALYALTRVFLNESAYGNIYDAFHNPYIRDKKTVAVQLDITPDDARYIRKALPIRVGLSTDLNDALTELSDAVGRGEHSAWFTVFDAYLVVRGLFRAMGYSADEWQQEDGKQLETIPFARLTRDEYVNRYRSLQV